MQEGIKITVILIDNGGFGSIGSLSTSVGSDAFGTKYRYRGADGQLSGDRIRVDFTANARSLGAHVIACRTIADLRAGLEEARAQTRATVLTIETDPAAGVPGYESWWDVPPAEVSEMDKVKAVRRAYEEAPSRRSAGSCEIRRAAPRLLAGRRRRRARPSRLADAGAPAPRARRGWCCSSPSTRCGTTT